MRAFHGTRSGPRSLKRHGGRSGALLSESNSTASRDWSAVKHSRVFRLIFAILARVARHVTYARGALAGTLTVLGAAWHEPRRHTDFATKEGEKAMKIGVLGAGNVGGGLGGAWGKHKHEIMFGERDGAPGSQRDVPAA